MNQTIQQYHEYVITSFVKAVNPVVIERAAGAVITDVNGSEFIDCFSGISVVNAGHCNPAVVAAAKTQLDKLIHCGSYLYHSQPTAELAQKLAEITPGRLKKSFFANSGAEAIEGAIKVAKLFTGKHEIISLHTSFHGRTWGTLSLTGNAGRKRRGGPYAPGIAFAPAPYPYRSQFGDDPETVGQQCAAALREVIRYSTAGDVAAFISEPVWGEGGIIVPPLGYFKAVQEVLDEHGILFIDDEVQTGFARTGKMFAIEHYGVEPDILVTAKGIAAGFPLAAFTTRDDIAAAFRPGEHLSTFGGNPVSCAAALANIEFIEQNHLCEQTLQEGEYLMQQLRTLQQRFPLIGEVRGLGLMIGIELVKDAAKTPAAAEAEKLKADCMDNGVLIGIGGVHGNVLRIQPPLVIMREQLDVVLTVIERSLRSLEPR